MSLLTPAEVAARLQCSQDTVRRHVPAVRIGGLYRYDEATVNAWIAQGGTAQCPETPTASISAPTRRTGGPHGQTNAGTALADRLGLNSLTIRAERKLSR